MNARTTIALATLLLSLNAFAASTPEQSGQANAAAESRPRGGDCIFSRTIDSWTVLDNETLLIYAPSRKSPYLVKLFRPEFGLKSEFQLGFWDRDNDGQICDVSRDAILLPGLGHGFADRIPIRSVQRITEAEANELIAKSKVKPERNPAVVSPEQSDMKSDKAGAQQSDKDKDQSSSKPPETA
jgi:Family of unknown function (DUF6491)